MQNRKANFKQEIKYLNILSRNFDNFFKSMQRYPDTIITNQQHWIIFKMVLNLLYEKCCTLTLSLSRRLFFSFYARANQKVWVMFPESAWSLFKSHHLIQRALVEKISVNLFIHLRTYKHLQIRYIRLFGVEGLRWEKRHCSIETLTFTQDIWICLTEKKI